MTKRISYLPFYKGFRVNVVEVPDSEGLGIYTEIMDSIINQVERLLDRHSRVHVLRFDCKFPSNWKRNRKLENEAASRLSQIIKDNLALKRWGGHKDVAYGWVFEVGEKNNMPHYHFFVAFKARTVALGAVTHSGCTGVLGMIQGCWKRLVGGSVWFSKTHTVNRGNQLEIHDCIYHLSYMSKVNTKVIGMGNTAKNFSLSRLK